jgi:hypothetical protein
MRRPLFTVAFMRAQQIVATHTHIGIAHHPL